MESASHTSPGEWMRVGVKNIDMAAPELPTIHSIIYSIDSVSVEVLSQTFAKPLRRSIILYTLLIKWIVYIHICLLLTIIIILSHLPYVSSKNKSLIKIVSLLTLLSVLPTSFHNSLELVDIEEMSLVRELPDLLQVFSNGTVKRLTPDIARVTVKSPSAFNFKDVTIDSSKPITARIFIPADDEEPSTSANKSGGLFPLLIYFHGGAFIMSTTTWSGYHYFLGDLSVAAGCVVVSVDYRLAPEHRLPAAYEDCYRALEWVTLNPKQPLEPWLEKADLSRVFLSGDSAGGNIAHHIARMATQNNVKINGILPIHPYFGSEKRTMKELETGFPFIVEMIDMFWALSVPEGSNRDYFGCNFEEAEMSVEEWSRFPAVVVFVAGLDFLKERGEMYVEFLKKKGVKEVRIVEAQGEQHIDHVRQPESEATKLLQKQIGEFIARF